MYPDPILTSNVAFHHALPGLHTALHSAGLVCSFSAYASLSLLYVMQALSFSFQNILKIDNLNGLFALVKLQLDNNIIEKIENISHLTNLEVWSRSPHDLCMVYAYRLRNRLPSDT